MTRIRLLLLTAALLVAAAACAADGKPAYYLALGDSLAAAVQPGGTDPARGYVARLHSTLPGKPRLRNLACSGATTVSLADGGGCSYAEGSQLAAAEKVLREHRVTLVTLDIGANDLLVCVPGPRVDEECLRSAFRTVETTLGRIVGRLRAAAGPDVKIVAMNYYNPYLASWLEGQAGRERAQRSQELSREFNAVLARVYGGAGIAVADVAAAFAGDDTAMVGGRPANVARVCDWTWMCGPHHDIHANDRGYQAIADAFRARL